MEISKREARQHMRGFLVQLNARSRQLKDYLRKLIPDPASRESYATNMPRMQCELAYVQKQLTVVHAMLALSRRRIHWMKGGAPQKPWEHQLEDKLKWQRGVIESRASHYLTHAWSGFSTTGDTIPALTVVWAGLIAIPDGPAREAAIRVGGPTAGYAI